MAALNEQAEDPDLWTDSAHARSVMRERTRLDAALAGYRRLERDFEDGLALAELAEEEDDDAASREAEVALSKTREEAGRREIESLLSGEADGNDCFLEVHAGAGGTESQDWAEMLLRMYVRWAERRGYAVEWIAESPGEEAGIKSAAIKVSGANAYGWLKTEGGVHRLVRISPFDAGARRHTSFASAWIYPVIDDAIAVEFSEKDLRIDTYRASGAGGQHVNRTDSAVRITHLPTGIVVQCQAERSQHRNKAAALSMLRARLYERALQERENEARRLADQKSDIGWGHQLRSYVLQPYRLVKDLRTNVESTNPDAVLDGGIDGFLAASLAARIGALGDPDERRRR